MKTYKKWKQGVYRPVNKDKCKTNICIYRSALELKFMRKFDHNPNIISWASEKTVIPYIKPTDGKVHRYFTDFNITVKNKNGLLIDYIVEVKPHNQLKKPKPSPRKKQRNFLIESTMYSINKAKFDAAKQYCKKIGKKFIILTERDLK